MGWEHETFAPSLGYHVHIGTFKIQGKSVAPATCKQLNMYSFYNRVCCERTISVVNLLRPLLQFSHINKPITLNSKEKCRGMLSNLFLYLPSATNTPLHTRTMPSQGGAYIKPTFFSVKFTLVREQVNEKVVDY